MTPARSILHLVLGGHGAGLLRSALGEHGLPGEVHCIHDDLGHGPLHDGAARIAYMRACYVGFDEWTHTGTDAFAEWRTLEDEVRREEHQVAIWAAQNASEGVLLAMACWRLRDSGVVIQVVEPANGRHIGRHSTSELAALWPAARTLGRSERLTQAHLFEQLRDAPGQRRRWAGNRIEAVGASAFDHLLKAEITAQWRPAADAVRSAMRRCEPRDGVSDLYLAWRLNHLIGRGEAETDRLPLRLSDYAVRTC